MTKNNKIIKLPDAGDLTVNFYLNLIKILPIIDELNRESSSELYIDYNDITHRIKEVYFKKDLNQKEL